MLRAPGKTHPGHSSFALKKIKIKKKSGHFQMSLRCCWQLWPCRPGNEPVSKTGFLFHFACLLVLKDFKIKTNSLPRCRVVHSQEEHCSEPVREGGRWPRCPHPWLLIGQGGKEPCPLTTDWPGVPVVPPFSKWIFCILGMSVGTLRVSVSCPLWCITLTWTAILFTSCCNQWPRRGLFQSYVLGELIEA